MKAWLALLGVLALFAAAQAAASPAPSGGGTTATVEGATVTITVRIDLCCLPKDTSLRDIYQQLVLAEIKAAQDMWNQALATFSAKGCFDVKVVFDAKWLNEGEAWDPGYHHINIDLIHPGRSGSVWPNNIPQNADSDWEYSNSLPGNFYDSDMLEGTWAHEIGHLMGLGDDYYEQHGLGHQAYACLPGREPTPENPDGTLMCNSSTGKIDQDLADRLVEILNRDGLLPQCWKGTMKISAALNRSVPCGRSDSWIADIKLVVSDKGVASGSGTANRASPVKWNTCSSTNTPCPSVQAMTFKATGDADKQSLRLKFGITGTTPSGTCDQTGFSVIFKGLPQRVNTFPLVGGSRAEADYAVSEVGGGYTGSIDATLDCTTCITSGAGAAP